jgi:hypothetical protein
VKVDAEASLIGVSRLAQIVAGLVAFGVGGPAAVEAEYVQER